MPTLGDHMASTFASCRRSLPDRIGCGGFVFWGMADGPAAVLGLEGTCTHCGSVWYTGDILSGREVIQPAPTPASSGTAAPLDLGSRLDDLSA